MTGRASLSRRLAIDRVKALVTTGTRDSPVRVRRHPGGSFQTENMNRMKLPAEPRLFSFIFRCRGTCARHSFGDLGIESIPHPNTVLNRVSERTAVGRPDGFSVIHFMIGVIVARRATANGRGPHLKIAALMFEMADRASDSGFLMSLCVRGVKLLRLMAPDTRVLNRFI